MEPSILGIHHVTAITSDAQHNVDFYTGVLGLRLVKVTVNYDDPGSYHLYYGDELGRPGSAMTFFAWPGGDARNPRHRTGYGDFILRPGGRHRLLARPAEAEGGYRRAEFTVRGRVSSVLRSGRAAAGDRGG